MKHQAVQCLRATIAGVEGCTPSESNNILEDMNFPSSGFTAEFQRFGEDIPTHNAS